MSPAASLGDTESSGSTAPRDAVTAQASGTQTGAGSTATASAATGSSGAPELPGWRHLYSGKVRDLYLPEVNHAAVDPASITAELADATMLLVVASDRVSAFDYVLSPGIPGKGALLTKLSRWWFGQLTVANHLADAASPVGSASSSSRGFPNDAASSSNPASPRENPPVPAEVADRAMLVRALNMLPIECVVRGYLTGSGWVEYQRSQTVCGIVLPPGLHDGDRLPEPIFTPAWKAPQGEHDENISFERVTELVGVETAAELRDTSLGIYAEACRIAEAKGLIVADTKFEFGRDRETGVLTLGDEVLTSDSSRYWDAAGWASSTDPAKRMASFDKQIVRDWLAANWDKKGIPPELPASIVARTAARYGELIDRLVPTE